jgi:Holliday junction resolvase RusA-like endonuclease
MILTISGETPSQKNRKIISMNRATGRPFLRSAPAVKLWQESASKQLISQFKGFKITEYPITVTLTFYFSTKRRKDLDNATSSVMDALTNSGIIEDDNINFIECIIAKFGGYDKENPRCEIDLED